MTLDIRYPIEYPVEQLFGWIFSGYSDTNSSKFSFKKKKEKQGNDK